MMKTSVNLPDLAPSIEATLRRGCTDLGLTANEQQVQLWLDYLQLLIKWNRAYNLTAVRDPAQMVVKHLLDSLAVAPLVTGQRLIDVGTGAGLPGIPLAIYYPDTEIHLLDSNVKKTRFLFQVKTELGLDNMTVHHQRVELYQPDQRFDAVLSRAFASLQDMVDGCRHLLRPQGRFLAMKGARPDGELQACDSAVRLEAINELIVPGLNEQRHLLELSLHQQ
jgi:16S rRNA (guanine527-N7)-methyltransferase